MNQKTTLQTTFLPDFCAGRIAFVVILLAELLAIMLSLVQPLDSRDRFLELALYSLFIQWVALSCVACLCLLRRPLQNLPEYWAATWAYLITIVVTAIISEVTWFLLLTWPAMNISIEGNHADFILRSMGISAIACALALRYFYVQHQWRRQIEAEAEARFQALQSRIRPHFLFNCMNTIASLIRRQPVLAEESIEDLADLFRASLQDIRHTSTLLDEISLCERYLRIEKHRLGERLQVEWQLDDLPMESKLPSLSLQPLLENAIYHGIEPLADGGTIVIKSENDADFYYLHLENPIADSISTDTHHDGNKLAQDNIRQRLAAYFGATATLSVTPEEHSYKVSIKIPKNYEHSDR